MTRANSSLKVALLGFDERSRETMRLIFDGPGKQCCTLTDEAHAEAGIINLDNIDGLSLWQRFRQHHPTQPLVIMSMKDPCADDALFLNKPVSQEQLLSTMQKLIEECRTSAAVEMKMAVGTTVTKPVAPPPKQHTIATETLKDEDFYNPQDFLQGELQTLVETSREKEISVKLNVTSSDAEHEIFLMTDLNRVVHRLSTTQLAQLCGTPAFLLELTARRLGHKASLALEIEAHQKKLGEPLQSFLWRVARYTSYGRLPLGTDITSSAYLAHWPNFTRLPANDNAMRIAALLVEKPRPLPLVAKVLNIPLREVFSFYSAAHALGMAGISQRDIDRTLQTEAPSPPRQHGLFGRLLGRLKEIGNTDSR